MPWAKLDDQIYFNRKMQECDGFARSFHIAAIVYCAGQLTDGYIPRPALSLITAMTGFDLTRKQTESIIRQLLASGLWEETESGYHIHDYLEYNPSAEKVKATRRASQEWRQSKRCGTASVAIPNAYATHTLPVANDTPSPSPTPNTYIEPAAPPPLAPTVTAALRNAGYDVGDFEMQAYWPLISRLPDIGIVLRAITKAQAKRAGIAYLFAIVSNELARASPPPPQRPRMTIVSVGKGFHEREDEDGHQATTA
jgi:hypothetical protein